jgi:hypothetical protein
MDLEAILKQLREERDKLDQSIMAIQRLAAGRHRGRGRPPKWLAKAKTEPKQRGQPRGRWREDRGEGA